MSDVSTFLLFVRVGFSLAIVLGLIWFAARVAKRRGAIAAKQSDTTIEVVARRSVGRRGSLVVVESSGRRLLVGVTDNHIDLVADLATGAAPAAPPVASDVVASPVDLDGDDPVVDDSIERLPVSLEVDDLAAPRRESLVDALRDLTVRR